MISHSASPTRSWKLSLPSKTDAVSVLLGREVRDGFLAAGMIQIAWTHAKSFREILWMENCTWPSTRWYRLVVLRRWRWPLAVTLVPPKKGFGWPLGGEKEALSDIIICLVIAQIFSSLDTSYQQSNPANPACSKRLEAPCVSPVFHSSVFIFSKWSRVRCLIWLLLVDMAVLSPLPRRTPHQTDLRRKSVKNGKKRECEREVTVCNYPRIGKHPLLENMIHER